MPEPDSYVKSLYDMLEQAMLNLPHVAKPQFFPEPSDSVRIEGINGQRVIVPVQELDKRRTDVHAFIKYAKKLLNDLDLTPKEPEPVQEPIKGESVDNPYAGLPQDEQILLGKYQALRDDKTIKALSGYIPALGNQIDFHFNRQ